MARLDLATKAIEAKQAIARESTIVLLPDQGTDAASVVAQAMTIINSMNRDSGVAAASTGANAITGNGPDVSRGGGNNVLVNR